MEICPSVVSPVRTKMAAARRSWTCAMLDLVGREKVRYGKINHDLRTVIFP